MQRRDVVDVLGKRTSTESRGERPVNLELWPRSVGDQRSAAGVKVAMLHCPRRDVPLADMLIGAACARTDRRLIPCLCENAKSNSALRGSAGGERWAGSSKAESAINSHCCRASLEDYVEQDNPVRVVDAFIDELDLGAIGFMGVTPAATGRPSYHPSTLLKLYLYGYLNRVQSSRRLEQEARRNVEVMWLTGRLAPDFKTIADFRKNNGAAIQSVCARFVGLCVDIGMFKNAVAAIDGSQVQGRQFAGPQFYSRQAQAPYGADHREHRPIPRSSRCRRPPGRPWCGERKSRG